MVDLEYLNKLLRILKDSGVSSFKDGGVELWFGGGTSVLGAAVTQPKIETQDHTVELPIDEASLPPDLRTDNINSMDTIMNWSGSYDGPELPIPGVDDKPVVVDFPDNPQYQALRQPMPQAAP